MGASLVPLGACCQSPIVRLEARRWDEAELVAGRCDKAELKLADRKTRRNWKESGGIGVCIKGVVN